MTKTFKVYHIICEGNSEEAYLRELNKYMREGGLEIFFNLYNLSGISQYANIRDKYRKAVRIRKKTDEIFIWLDNDVFKRGKLSKDELKKKLTEFSCLKYNYENFEDFLAMHLLDKQVQCWHEVCTQEKHFDTPMVGDVVERSIRKIFPGYSKGFLPQEIQINDESLSRLCKNQKNPEIRFKSDFVDVIKQLLKISN